MVDYTLPLDQLPDPLPIEPLTKPFDVTITPPGSKSITCRAYVLAALAKGESRIIRPLRADDTDLLLDALCTLGAKARWVSGEGHDGEDVLIKGVNGRFPRGGEVNLGHGGTPARFMIACAGLAVEPVVVDGSPRMRERPIAEGVEMLRQLGAKIEYVEKEGCLPVRVVPSEDFKGGEIEVGKTQSSQFVSALMLIGSWLEAGAEIRFVDQPPSATYLVLTQHVLGSWRPDLAPVVRAGSPTRQFWSGLDGALPPALDIATGSLEGRVFRVEPDASSAAYWFVASWICPPSRIEADRFSPHAIQSDLRILLELNRANLADVGLSMFDRSRAYSWWVNRGRKTGKLKCDCSLFPDGAITLAVGSATLKGKSRLTGLHTLRMKETDRLAALEAELTRVGCKVETTDDSITIHPIARDADGNFLTHHRRDACATAGTAEPDPIIIDTYNDHRMAMAFAVLGLRVPGIQIRDPEVVSKSYPGFWKDFAKLYGEGNGE